MEHKIIVVGIGPGAPDYLLPTAKEAIANAVVLVGSKRALADYGQGKTRTMEITGKIEATIAFIHDRLAISNVTVMVSGDPGFYSMLEVLRRSFPPSRLVVIPGISSTQLAFSRLALPWQEASLISLHGRLPQAADFAYRRGRILGLLTDTVYHTQKIGDLLCRYGWPRDTQIFICTRLSYEDEYIRQTDLAGIGAVPRVSHCVMVVVG